MKKYYNTMKTPQYGNYSVYSKDFALMFRCQFDKANWYIKKGLAEWLDDTSIRLNFTTNGVGKQNDPYFLQDFVNVCVICGKDNGLTRHHIVPYCYRRLFPKKIKNHNGYDVVPLCVDCHVLYEDCAQKFKIELGEKYQAPIQGIGKQYDKKMSRIKGAAVVLLRHKDAIPQERLIYLTNLIDTYLNRKHEEKDLKDLAKIKPVDESGYMSHGQLVLSKISDLNEFVCLWRKHFVENMKPQFMPKGFDVNRSADGSLQSENK